jgi:transcription antitermination factor NusG
MNRQMTAEIRTPGLAFGTPSPLALPPSGQQVDLSDEIIRGNFTSGQNPFLFPLDLLDLVGFDQAEGADVTEQPAGEDPGAKENKDVQDCHEVPHWWLVHSKPRQEKKLAEQLGLLGVSHYLPVTKCTAMTRGRPRITRAPLFAGYLFLHGNTQQRRSVLETNRTVAIHPVADRLGIVRQLWNLADLIEKGIPLRIEERLISGQYVRVKSGLLKDKCGIVMKRVGKTRLYVFVNELLGGVSLEIEQHLLEPFGDAPKPLKRSG